MLITENNTVFPVEGLYRGLTIRAYFALEILKVSVGTQLQSSQARIERVSQAVALADDLIMALNASPIPDET